MNKSIYLAGAIKGTTYEESTSWRDYVLENIDSRIDCYSPMRGKDYLIGLGEMPDTFNSILSTQSAIMTRDMYDVASVDALIVYLVGAKRVSIGTMIEVGAAYALRKPIILVMEEENVHRHPMLLEAARYGYLVEDLEDAIYCAEHLLLPAKPKPFKITASGVQDDETKKSGLLESLKCFTPGYLKKEVA